MRIVPVPCLKDNYAYLVIAAPARPRPSSTPRRPAPVREALRARRRAHARPSGAPTTTTTTSAATRSSRASSGLEVVGARVRPRARARADARAWTRATPCRVGDVEARCIHIPGHTLGAVAYFVDRPAR